MDLTPRQIEKALFDAALQFPDPAARHAFLEQTCRESPGMRDRLTKLLEAAGPAAEFFEIDPLQSGGEEMSDPPPLEDSQVRIGRYRLLLRIGEGGCGVVYSAEQDGPVTRRVALKIIRLGMDTERVIARFELERQALAMMDHPNIAQVLDAGATANGRPFFVMELVTGVRITTYCDEHSLDTAERLALFLQVCSAIQHAHQKGIVHRDIKPSNVLVTGQSGIGVPKVIDFGIAKAVEGRLSGKDSVTALDQLVGTPAYMSPEQLGAGGVDIDTRSDIYSLGALLYELLTGRPPFDTVPLLASGLEKMRRVLQEVDPPLPSRVLMDLPEDEQQSVARLHRVERNKLFASLRGDLDWVVMKAMEKDRARRYATVNGLAADIERYLANEPVHARPPDRWYRFQKFVLRNRGYLAAGAAVVLALAAGLGTSSYLFLREREARHVQAQLREDAEDRERIANAAVLVNQHRLDEADHLLDQLHHEPSRPSLDGIAAYRWVAEWLALHGDARKAARRFFILLKVNEFDNREIVSMDYVSCGSLYAALGDSEGFEKFRSFALANLKPNADVGPLQRFLRMGLLRPASTGQMDELAPHAALAAKVSLDHGDDSGWLAVSVALWKFRQGEFRDSLDWCERLLAHPPDSVTVGVVTRTLVAMNHFHLGQELQARADLAPCAAAVREKFSHEMVQGGVQEGYWFDWVYAKALLTEAETLMPSLRKSAD
jgi:serine/threonine protein kinase